MVSSPSSPRNAVGPQQPQPERPVRQERLAEDLLLAQGRDDERVEPHEEAGRDPRVGSPAVAAPPVEPEQDGGRALGHRDEGQQPHLDQQELAVLHARPGEAQRHHRQHREPGVEESDPVDVLHAPAPQQHGQDDVVGDHLGEREGVHHDHGGGRREAAQEHEHRDELAVEGQRQAEDEPVGLRARLREDEEAREGDRQHEDVDQEQVEREGPGDRVDVALALVLDDQHVELPRQEHHRQHRDHQHRGPARVGRGARLVEGEQARQLGIPRPPGRRDPRSRRRDPTSRRRRPGGTRAASPPTPPPPRS